MLSFGQEQLKFFVKQVVLMLDGYGNRKWRQEERMALYGRFFKGSETEI
jgi:hypothetical protein